MNPSGRITNVTSAKVAELRSAWDAEINAHAATRRVLDARNDQIAEAHHEATTRSASARADEECSAVSDLAQAAYWSGRADAFDEMCSLLEPKP